MTFRPVTIDDGRTTFDLFEYRLQKSLHHACLHHDKIMHNSGQCDNGEWFRTYDCPDCDAHWQEFERQD